MNSSNATLRLRPWDLILDHCSKSYIEKRCTYLHHLDPSKRCNFTMYSQCDAESHIVHYHYFLFCMLPNPSFDDGIFITVIIMLVLWILLLFLILGITADEFFCPALGIISKLLRLSENLAGVTLLAWGNGAADILSSVSDPFGETILMYNELLGSAMFVTCVVAGYVAFIRPFNLQAYPFLRDLLFILGSNIWIVYTVQDEAIHLYEAISYLVIYLLYIIVCVGGFLIQNKLTKFIKIEDKPVEWDSSSNGDEEKNMKIKRGKVTCREMWADLWHHLKPILDEEWAAMNKFEKVLAVAKSPVLLVFRFFIPVIQVGEDKDGWCKLLNTIQCIFFPSYVIATFDKYMVSIYGVTIFVIAVPVGILLAVIVYLTSDFDKPPKYHKVFAVMGLLCSMGTIYFFVLEVVAVLTLFGTLGHIKIATLALTVLAWGNSIGDAVSNIQIAKQGFQRMAFAGCFGGPIANTLLSFGLTFLIRDLASPTHTSQVRTGSLGPNCSTFLLINLTYSILYILLTNFKARKSYGAFLILLYCEFVLYCILCEAQLVHPLGTDHEFDVELYSQNV